MAVSREMELAVVLATMLALSVAIAKRATRRRVAPLVPTVASAPAIRTSLVYLLPCDPSLVLTDHWQGMGCAPARATTPTAMVRPPMSPAARPVFPDTMVLAALKCVTVVKEAATKVFKYHLPFDLAN